uniref:Pentatricopeptide repeat-containing protein n=1 Tax=Solanum tuberosum TaxID=4113 RepID=M1D003_SOLTU
MQGLGAPEILQNFHSHPSCFEVYESDLCLLLSPLNIDILKTGDVHFLEKVPFDF